MSFTKKTIRDIDVKGKRVLVRADYNVPILASGAIADDYRIEQSLPTLKYLLEQNCKIIVISHLGRPTGSHDKHCSLRPVAKRLQDLLKVEVNFVEDCIGPAVTTAVKKLKKKQILVLENVRFYTEEEKNNKEFAKALATHADVFIQDGFGVVHRAHASTEAITKFLPSVAGFLLEREVATITDVIKNPKRPLMAIIGGAKISDKIEILERFVDIADFVAVGGAMANTFLLAEGIKTGKSLAEPHEVPMAKDIIEKAKAKAEKQQFIFYLPQDGVAATKADKMVKTRIVEWNNNVIADIENYPQSPPRYTNHLLSNERILDIGPFSGAFIAGGIQLAETVIWNGTMGVTEVPALPGQGPVGPFAHGTELIVDAMMGGFGHKPFSVVGGGDTVAYVEQRKLTNAFDHVSTGGGASMELMSGKKLPGVEALLNK